MQNLFLRSEMLLGTQALDVLKKSSVIVFGAGGVGSFVIEALARSGVGHIGICDSDKIAPTNINRQLYALNSTIGKKKVDIAKERIKDINPDVVVDTYDFFFDNDTADIIDYPSYDYVVDAIDSMDSKVLLIAQSHEKNMRIISALSAGNKLDPTRFRVSDVYSTTVCPIAKILRKKLRELGISSHKVVYSDETPSPLHNCVIDDTGKAAVGSLPFVPSVMGLIMAKEIIFDLIERS